MNAIDAVLVGPPSEADVGPRLTEITEREHPRVRRAQRYRSDVRVWRCDGGIVLLGRGFAGRIETAAEVDVAARNRGLGRALFAAARHLAVAYTIDLGLPPQPVWAQVSPANVASVRALNVGGYLPVGAEALFVP